MLLVSVYFFSQVIIMINMCTRTPARLNRLEIREANFYYLFVAHLESIFIKDSFLLYYCLCWCCYFYRHCFWFGLPLSRRWSKRQIIRSLLKPAVKSDCLLLVIVFAFVRIHYSICFFSFFPFHFFSRSNCLPWLILVVSIQMSYYRWKCRSILHYF